TTIPTPDKVVPSMLGEACGARLLRGVLSSIKNGRFDPGAPGPSDALRHSAIVPSGRFLLRGSGAPTETPRRAIRCKSPSRSEEVTDQPHGPAFAFIRVDCGVPVSTDASTGASTPM